MTIQDWILIGSLLGGQAVAAIVNSTKQGAKIERLEEKIKEQESIAVDASEALKNTEIRVFQSIDDMRRSVNEMTVEVRLAMQRLQHDAKPGYKLSLDELKSIFGRE